MGSCLFFWNKVYHADDGAEEDDADADADAYADIQGLEFRLDNEEEGPVPKPCLGQHAVLGIQVSSHPH